MTDKKVSVKKLRKKVATQNYSYVYPGNEKWKEILQYTKQKPMTTRQQQAAIKAQQKAVKENMRLAKEEKDLEFKRNARLRAVDIAQYLKLREPRTEDKTALKKFNEWDVTKEAEKIYQWLIKVK